MLIKWITNAFIALLLSAIIALYSLIVQRNMRSIINKLQERLSYYEWEDGTEKQRCANCGIHPTNYRAVRYGATWCKDCCPK